MSLSKIKNELYKREFDKDLSRRGQSEFDAAKNKKKEDPNINADDVWKEKAPGLDPAQKKAIKAGVIVLGSMFLLAAVFVGFFKFKQASFSEDRVVVSMAGPKEAESGNLLTYTINYSNNNRAALSDVSLRVTYPENFKPEGNSGFTGDGYTSGVFAVDNLPGKGAGEVVLNGRVYSPRGTLMYLKAELSYAPSGFNSRFASASQVGVAIASTPITLEVFAPANIASGDAVDYVMEYKNEGETTFDDLRVRVEYPGGFSFSRAEPAAFNGNDVWYVGTLSAGQKGKIVVSGKLEGERDQVKTFRAYIGALYQDEFMSYNEERTETDIVASPLAITQSVNGEDSLNVNSGDELRFLLKFRNNGDIGLRDVIVMEKIESPVLDYDTLDIQQGAFDFDQKSITWKASDFPTLKYLEPGQEGQIGFQIKVKEIIPVKSKNDNNFVISAIAKIDSPDVPTPIEMNKVISGNKLDIRLNSKLVLGALGFYQDALLPNSGPVPPKVDQETTYTIHWRASNISNDVKNARVEAVLPTGVVITGAVSPSGAGISYNERSNAVVWDIGNVKAGTGVLNSPLETAFQIRVKPSLVQAGQAVDLLGPSTFSAQDNFTGENLSAEARNKTTVLPEDKSLESNEYIVN